MKHCKNTCRQGRQRGVVLPITLIVLVAMTLAGIALLRSLDTSSLIAGNLAFRQSATASGDNGTEKAISWLWDQTQANGQLLQQDSLANGYYATRQDALDMTGNATVDARDNLNWDDKGSVKVLPADSAGNVVSYVIHRMCANAGKLNSSTCSMEQSSRTDGSKGILRQMLTYQPGGWNELANRVYYRITARITGPRNTTSYVQVVVLI